VCLPALHAHGEGVKSSAVVSTADHVSASSYTSPPQDLAKHMQADGASADALREQLDQAAAERAAALKDVQYLSAQLQSLLDKQDGRADQVRNWKRNNDASVM